jgi:hypothetical protein
MTKLVKYMRRESKRKGDDMKVIQKENEWNKISYESKQGLREAEEWTLSDKFRPKQEANKGKKVRKSCNGTQIVKSNIQPRTPMLRAGMVLWMVIVRQWLWSGRSVLEPLYNYSEKQWKEILKEAQEMLVSRLSWEWQWWREYVIDSRSPILVTLMMEVIRSFEKSILTRAIRRNIPEERVLHSHRR